MKGENIMDNKLKRITWAAVLLLIAVLSALVIANWAAAPATHAATIRSIDEKTETVLRLTATSTLASAGITAIPGDMATPIAEKLADFTEYFLLILCVLYAEKYLLTVLGLGVFRFVIPAACLAGIGAALTRSAAARKIGVRLAALGLALFVLVPVSIGVSDLVYNTYRSSIDATISAAEDLTDETSALGGEEKTPATSWLGGLAERAEELTHKASGILRRYVETLAVMIVTSCVIPILSLLFFLWLLRQLTGVDLIGYLPHGRERVHPGARPRE